MRKLFRKFLRLSVTWQMIIIISCIIIPINFISLFYAGHAQKSFVIQSREAAAHVAQLYLNQLDDRVYYSDSYMSEEINSNPRAIALRGNLRSDNYITDAILYWFELYKRTKVNSEADAYFFYLPDVDYGDVAVVSRLNSQRSALKAYVRENVSSPKSLKWYIDVIDGEKWLIHVISDSGYYHGIMIHLGTLEQKIADSLSLENVKVFMDSDGTITEEDGSEVLCLKAGKTETYVHIFLDRKEILAGMPMMQQVGFVLAVIYLLCVPLLILVIKCLIIRPLQNYAGAFEQMERGNLDYRLPAVSRNKETSDLNQKYNTMAQTIKTLKIEVYEKEMQRMDVEATNLKLQVRPHFILNCLNIIFSMAKSEKISDIKQFTKYLSGYFRHSLWNVSGMVAFREEMACINDYVQVQKVRFPNAFTYIENIDPEVETVQVPTMIVMNFVENSLKYALKMGSEIELIVIARREEDCLVVSVCDTGNGMDDETLQTLRKGEVLENDTGRHIGIWNCRRRLAMLYGDRAQIHMTSAPGEGTQVFLRIPINNDVEAKAFDSGNK